MVQRLERQLKEAPVSEESTLYLSDAVVWGRVSYKAFIGDMSRGDLEELEKRIRFVFLKAYRLPKSLSKEMVHLAAGLGGLGYTSWYDRLMNARVFSLIKWVDTESPLGFMYRWTLEQFQLESLMGRDRQVSEAVNDSPRTTPRWLEQLVAWMEERSLCLVGNGNMPGSVPGDVPLVDMGENAEERAVLRGAVRANGRVWLSQVLSASGRAVLTTTGIPEV